MERIDISCEQFRQALAWLNGQSSTLGEREVLTMLRSLTEAFRENCRMLRPGPIPRFRGLTLIQNPLSISALLAEQQEAERVELPTVETGKTEPVPEAPQEIIPAQPVIPEEKEPAKPEEERLDSVLLINAIAHVGATAGYPLTQSRAQIILYCLYGTALASGRGRLAIEHPQAWKYGPVFPRAYKRGSISDRGACAESYHELLEREPSLVGPLSTKTQSMMATPMADLNAVHKGAQSPYGRVLSQNPEKWGTPIPDEAIAEFFRRKSAG